MPADALSSPPTLPQRHRGKRRWLIIVLANLIAVVVILLGCELVARGVVWAWEIPTEFQPQPFQGFGQTDPIVWWRLRSNLDTWMNDVRLRTNREGFRHPRDQAPPGALRVYCLGDSTTFGWGVRDTQMYTRLAQDAIEDSTGREVEIVSTGVPGYTSYQCLEQFRDQIAEKRPDWVVVMASNNECRARNVGDRDRGRMLARKRSLHAWLGFSRIWVLLSRAPETLTRTWDLEPSPGRVADTPGEYVQNLADLVREARAAGCRVMFMNMPLHLTATPIWKHYDQLSPEVASLLDQAENERAGGGSLDRRETLLRKAIQLQPDQFAGHWELAQTLSQQGRTDEAREHLTLAREADLHPDAAKPSYNQALAAFCQEQKVPMVDLDQAFRDSGLDEDELFLDHCHPNAAGHRIIGRELAKALQEAIAGR